MTQHAPPEAGPVEAAASDSTDHPLDWRRVDWPSHTRTAELEHATVSYADLGSGEPAVLLVHGLGGQWRNWLCNIPAVARHRRCVAVDLPGFGGSRMKAGGVSISAFARALDELCERLGLERVVAVGNSMGGFAAAELALEFPRRVEQLVLVDAAGLMPTREERWRAVPALRANALLADRVAGAHRALAARPRLRRAMLRLVVADPDSLDADMVFHGLLDAPRPGMGQALSATVAYLSHHWGESLGRIECPTLVTWGDADALIPVRHAHEYARRIPGARTHIFERTGHMPMVERPDEFNRVLLEFAREGTSAA